MNKYEEIKTWKECRKNAHPRNKHLFDENKDALLSSFYKNKDDNQALISAKALANFAETMRAINSFKK